jgi:hypothetical protein
MVVCAGVRQVETRLERCAAGAQPAHPSGGIGTPRDVDESMYQFRIFVSARANLRHVRASRRRRLRLGQAPPQRLDFLAQPGTRR